jgi:hypothetical protein
VPSSLEHTSVIATDATTDAMYSITIPVTRP